MTEQTTTATPMEVQVVEAYLDGDEPLAQEMLDEVNLKTGITQPDADAPDAETRLPVMPDAPQVKAGTIEAAAASIAELGPAGQQLVAEWGGPTSSDFRENMTYAHEAVKALAKSHPEIIAFFDSEIENPDGTITRPGSHPEMIRLAAQYGRMKAGLMGDFSVARNYEAPSRTSTARSYGSGKSAAQAEFDQLYRDNPPGTERYKNPNVQARIHELSRRIAGDDAIVGTSGRTA